jgi:hypothetical protein
MLYPLKVFRDLFRGFYIFTLFRDAIPYRLGIPKVTGSDTADTGIDN